MTSLTALSLGAQAESEQAVRDREAAMARCLVCQCHDLDPLDATFAHLAPGYPAEVAS